VKLYESVTEVRLRPITVLLRCALNQIEPQAVSIILPPVFSHCSYLSFCLQLTRSPAVARIADHTACQWSSRSSKVDDFHFIWLMVTLALSFTISKIWPVFHWICYPASFNPNLKMFSLH